MLKFLPECILLSLLCTVNLMLASTAQDARERKRVQDFLKDPIVRRALATRNPLVMTHAIELKQRQRDRAAEFIWKDTSDNKHFCINPDRVAADLNHAGFGHFMEKTNFMQQIAQQKNFSKKELDLFVNQALAAYLTYMSAGPENIQSLLREIMPQRKEHILEILVNAAQKDNNQNNCRS